MTDLLNYTIQGEGPDLVLIHGLFGSLENLGLVARPLSADYRVISIDLPNHGRSPRVDVDGMSLSAMAQQLGRVIDHLQLQQPCLLGHSLGGKVAMQYCLQNPDKVSKLIVADIAPVSYQPRHQGVFNGLNSLDLSSLKSRGEAERLMRAHIEEEGVRLFLLKSLEPNPEAPGFRWRMNVPVLQQAYEQLIAAPCVAKFDRPVLFIKGAESDYILTKHQPQVLQRFAQAQLKIIAGTGHWLHAQKPAVFVKLVQRFLKL